MVSFKIHNCSLITLPFQKLANNPGLNDKGHMLLLDEWKNILLY
jgi:hypothetical protein